MATTRSRVAGPAARLVGQLELGVVGRRARVLLHQHGAWGYELRLVDRTEARQAPDGRFSATVSFVGSGPHDDGAAAAGDVLDAIKALLPSAASLACDFHAVAMRPVPHDRLPIVGQAAGIEGLHVAVTHSGVTLAPAIGRFVAEEIMTGRREPLLAPFGLERLAPH